MFLPRIVHIFRRVKSIRNYANYLFKKACFSLRYLCPPSLHHEHWSSWFHFTDGCLNHKCSLFMRFETQSSTRLAFTIRCRTFESLCLIIRQVSWSKVVAGYHLASWYAIRRALPVSVTLSIHLNTWTGRVKALLIIRERLQLESVSCISSAMNLWSTWSLKTAVFCAAI